MTSATTPNRASWTDRWNQPTVESLLDSLKAHHRRQFVHLMDKLNDIPGMDKSVIWYGPSWKWTIAYTLQRPTPGTAAAGSSAANGKGAKRSRSSAAASPRTPAAGLPAAWAGSEVFCYLVPSVETPTVCVPLAEPHAEKICQGPLSRYLREGINTAKCAVSIRWATWNPATESESTQLGDLLKKKHQLLTKTSDRDPRDN